ncbi:hypothetical protein, partial [Alteromonas sp. KUL42]|uniref:hypothetical protein n=1 Tax=Alteromonas sp. KUL42 TaxID=2480797 RepID=UPI001A9461DE
SNTWALSLRSNYCPCVTALYAGVIHFYDFKTLDVDKKNLLGLFHACVGAICLGASGYGGQRIWK